LSKEIILSQGKVAIVDDELFEWLNRFNWHYANVEYASGNIDGERIFMHRLIMDAPKGIEVDHKNRNKLDNRKENLRLCNSKENKRNIKKKNKDSEYHGIRRDKTGEKWSVSIRTDEGIMRVGTFTDKVAAANARNYYAKIYHGEFAFLNDCPYMEKEEWEKFKTKPFVSGKSEYKGVRRAARGNKWQAHIYHEGKQLHIGHFDTEEEAALAYNIKAIEIYGTDTYLNTISDELKNKVPKKSIRRNRTSQYRGVYLCAVTKKKWIAEIYHNGKDIKIGRFNSEIEAARAYNEKAIELKGDKAKLNNLEEKI
jgi:hypothetical protein